MDEFKINIEKQIASLEENRLNELANLTAWYEAVSTATGVSLPRIAERLKTEATPRGNNSNSGN